MELERLQEVVEAYHFDLKNPESTEEFETEINVGLSPIEEYEEKPDGSTAMLSRLEFRLVFPEYYITGAISQLNIVKDRIITEENDVAQDEVEELVAPLFDMVKRLTFEVTEIAMDQPGLELSFQQNAAE
ncbi:MAG: DUF1149 family protein [Streptococcaceae bacterium]|nr:DUF1149 family protein [Streptococcaceae bacterium]